MDGSEVGKRWAGAQQTDAKVSPLTCVAISGEPVRTEPAAAGAAIQSYAATGKGTVSISYRNVAAKVVTGPAPDQNAGSAISGQGCVRYSDAAAVKQPDAAFRNR